MRTWGAHECVSVKRVSAAEGKRSCTERDYSEGLQLAALQADLLQQGYWSLEERGHDDGVEVGSKDLGLGDLQCGFKLLPILSVAHGISRAGSTRQKRRGSATISRLARRRLTVRRQRASPKQLAALSRINAARRKPARRFCMNQRVITRWTDHYGASASA